jgi:hypothetical protein
MRQTGFVDLSTKPSKPFAAFPTVESQVSERVGLWFRSGPHTSWFIECCHPKRFKSFAFGTVRNSDTLKIIPC